MRVSLFITCFNDTLFPRTGEAVVRVLERLGHEVEFPSEQTCCGQMHANSGYEREALPLVRRFARVFCDREAIVCPSGSCVAMVAEHYPRLAEFAGDAALAQEVEALTGRVHEFASFIANVLCLEDVGAYFPHRVAYHPTCHSLRALRVGDAPLLPGIPTPSRTSLLGQDLGHVHRSHAGPHARQATADVHQTRVV